MKHVELSHEDACDFLGEAIHTGLRKGSDAPDAHDLWQAISASNTTAWSDAIEFAVHALEQGGIVLCTREETPS